MSWIHNQETSSFEGYLITTKNQKLLTGWLSYGKDSFYTKDESLIFRWNEPITLDLHITNNSPNTISNIQAKIYKGTTLLTTKNITSIAAGATYEAPAAYTYTISKNDITNGNGELIFKIELSSSTDTDVNITTYDLPIKISDEITFDDFGIGKLEWANGTTFSSSMNANVNINNFNSTETVTYKLYLWNTLQTAYTMTSNAKETLTKSYSYNPTYWDRYNYLIEIPYYFTVTDSNGTIYTSDTNFLKYEISSSANPIINNLWIDIHDVTASDSYALGEEIELSITVCNDSSRPFYDINLQCLWYEDSSVICSWQIGTLDIFETSQTFYFRHKITENDILYYAKTGDYPTLSFEAIGYIDKEHSDSYLAAGPGEITVEDSNPHLSCDIIMASREDVLFDLNDKCYFNCSIENDGNSTITDITLTCEISGDEWPIESLAPGEKKFFETYYEITAADILAGEFILECYATGTSPDPNELEVPVAPGQYPLLCVDPIVDNISMTMTLSPPANGNNYVLGENVGIELTWTNDNNVDGVYIYCREETDILGMEGIKLSSFINEPGLSYSYIGSHTITEDDLLTRSVSLVFSMQAIENVNNITEEWTESWTITNIEAPNPELSLSFETTGTWAEYEDISITAIIQNTGNLTLNNYTLHSEETGDDWTPTGTLGPGGSQIFSAQAQLYPEDIEQGYKDVDWLAQANSQLQNFTTVKYNTIQRVTSSSLQ